MAAGEGSGRGSLRRALWLGRVYVFAVWQRGDAAMGVPLDPMNNSRRYWGSPQAPEETSWEYRGAP